MLCPACKTRTTEERYENTFLRRCPSCHGAWLDSEGLKEILRSHEQRFDLDLIWQTLFDSGSTQLPPEVDERSATCPICREELVSTVHGLHSGIVVDLCPRKHGVFLEIDELEKVQIFQEFVRDYLESSDRRRP
jgi:Zn-finger nucleic acid-binding protein